ncbi:MAG: N4-gp56 family major capsid protein [Firmicutes bacterium]|nr:N4-gp56 family major capsid protein [Bacillota bacterium]
MATDRETLLNMNKTTSSGVAPLMQAVLNRHLIETTKPVLVHTQFGQKVPIPKGQTKTITWDKMSPLPKAKTPLEEGITPKGSAVHITRITGEPNQYGNYISFTDQLDFFAHDPSPKVLNYNELLGDNAAETLESLAADVLSSSTNVQYAGGVTSRSAITETLTVEEVRKAVRTLKGNKAKKIEGDYICIVHTDIAHDLMSDDDWKMPHTYSDTKELYSGEIGKLYGVRFMESPDAKVFYGTELGGEFEELSIVKVDTTNNYLYVAEEITSTVASALAGTAILVNGLTFTISSAVAGENGGAYLVVSGDGFESINVDMKIYPGDGTASGKPVYSTLVLGANAYGTTGLKNTLENISKGLGSAGTADPLNQRGTMAWKAYHLTKVLVPEFMVRIESVSTRY